MARKPRRPELYPLPVETLFHHPAYVALPAAGRGMLLSVLEHFWRTRCRPLPKGDDLAAICRWHRPTWVRHRQDILDIFSDVEPELRAYFHKREGGKNGLSVIQMLGSSAAARKAHARRIEGAQTAQTAADAGLLSIPIVEPGRRAADVERQRLASQSAPAPETTRTRLRA